MLSKRAFSLLDICSCSAIIGLSGAIITPLLKTGGGTEINRSGALARAVLLYVEDNNNHYPLAMTRRPDGTWRWSTMHPVPANVVASGMWDGPDIVAATSTFWANSIRWYTRSREDYKEPTQESHAIADTFAPGVTPLEVGLTFNGFLHAYANSSVVEPGLVPVIWAGTGSIAVKGRAVSNPMLHCGGNSECSFKSSAPFLDDSVPTETPRGTIIAPYQQFPDTTVWAKRLSVNSGGGTIAFADGSAKFMKWATTLAPAVSKDASKDMFASIELQEGKQKEIFHHATNSPDCTKVDDSTTSGPNVYPCFFRPDRIK